MSWLWLFLVLALVWALVASLGLVAYRRHLETEEHDLCIRPWGHLGPHKDIHGNRW